MTISSNTPTGARDVGRREANKLATRTAIQEAADRLIAERGFEATTVREIADAAKVTERTFYRYFDGKEGLIADEAAAWRDRLHEAIIARPEQEPPLLAVKLAMLDLAHGISERPRSERNWLFTDQAGAIELLRLSGVRPLLRLEEGIINAILARTATAQTGTGREVETPDQLTIELLARVSVAVLRTIAIHRRRAPQKDLRVDKLLQQAFDSLVELALSGNQTERAPSDSANPSDVKPRAGRTKGERR